MLKGLTIVMVNGFKTKGRSYAELKSDPTVRFSWLSWLLEKKLFYVGVIATGALVAMPVMQAGAESLTKINEEYEEPSPYLSINPAVSHGVAWAKELIKNSHDVGEWTVLENTQPSHGFLKANFNKSVSLIPDTLLATTVGKGAGHEAFIQVYGAGQARKQFNNYTTQIQEKTTFIGSNTESGIVYITYDSAALMVAGDSIVGILADSPESRDSQLTKWLASLEETLPASSCVTVNAMTDESSRSLFYGEANYTGLQEIQTVETEVNMAGLPTVTGTQLLEISDVAKQEPEAPLPPTIQKQPKEVTRPTLTGAPRSEGGFIVDASYLIADPVGPGCGWEWSAQRALVYDNAQLESDKNLTIEETQNAVNEKAQTYINSQISWARMAALFLPKADNWNKYVNKMNNLHATWAELDAGRAAFKPTWDAYLNELNNWKTFDARKAEALSTFETAEKACLAQNKTLEEWEKSSKKEEERLTQQKEARELELETFESDWETKLSTLEGEDLTTAESEKAEELKLIEDRMKKEDEERVKFPAKPNACTPPEKPSILNEEKPVEPTAPTPPENITIPNSWPKEQ